jgi:hypothetical protein
MPAIPGPAAFAAFVGVKFGGYILAGTALRKLQPAITASSIKIAAVRTGLGVLLGPPITLAAIIALEHFTHPSPDSSTLALYPFLFSLRILIWALVIFHFYERVRLGRIQIMDLRMRWSVLVLSLGFARIRTGDYFAWTNSDMLIPLMPQP